MELIKCINSLKDVDHDKMFLGNVRQNLAQSGREILIIILCYDRFKHSDLLKTECTEEWALNQQGIN